MREAHVGMGSGVLHIIMGIDATVGMVGTASLLGRWTPLYSQVAAFHRIFLWISLLYLATMIPAPLTVPPKGGESGWLT